MKTRSLRPYRPLVHWIARGTLLLTLAGLVTGPSILQGAGKKDDSTGHTFVDAQFIFDYLSPGLASDCDALLPCPYVHDEDFVSAQVGQNGNMYVWLGQASRKQPPTRHLWLMGNPFADADLLGAPALAWPSSGPLEVELPKAAFQIYLPTDPLAMEAGASEIADARLVIVDDAGRTWEVWSSVSVDRVGDAWTFTNEAGSGYLYAYPEGKGPSGLIEMGDVSLPLSGRIQTLDPVP